MRFDRAKMLKIAEKLVRSGKIMDAASAFKKLADDNPRDLNVANKLGDILLRAGSTQEALRCFLRIAEVYAKDGFFLKAIALYKKITKIDPGNLDCLDRLAGLYRQQGLTIEAKGQYLQVADQLVKQGKITEATGVLPKVLEIEPDNLKVRLSLAELMVRAGTPVEAAREYAYTARRLYEKNMVEEAFRVGCKACGIPGSPPELLTLMLTMLRRCEQPPKEVVGAAQEIADKDGNEPLTLAFLGMAHRAVGDADRADDAFVRLCKRLEMSAEAPPEVAEVVSAYHLSQDRPAESYEWLSRAVDGFMSAGRFDEAAASLDRFLDAVPDHRAALTSRVEIASKAEDRVTEVVLLQRLASILIETAEKERAREVLNRLLVLEPDNERFMEMLTGLQDLEETAAADSAEPTIDEAARGSDLQEAEDDEEICVVEAEGAPESSMEEPARDVAPVDGDSLSSPEDEEISPSSKIQEMQAAEDGGEPEDKDFIGEHFTEAEVFLRYGLLAKAREQLQAILKRYPHHVPAYVKLKEVFIAEGNKDDAVETCLALARMSHARGESDEARRFINEAVGIDPGNARISAVTGEIGTEPAAEVAEPSEVPGGDLIGGEMEYKSAEPVIDPEGPDVASSDLEIEFEMPDEVLDEPSRAVPAGSEEMRAASDEPAVEVEGEAEIPGVEIEDTESIEPPAVAAPIEPAIEAEVDEEVLSFEIEDIETVESPAMTAPGDAPSENPDPESLGEVDFYIAQGLVEEARQVALKLRERFPESEEVTQRLRRMDDSSPQEPDPAPPQEDPVGVDLEVERVFGGGASDSEPADPVEAPRAARPSPVFRMETPVEKPGGDYFDLAAELGRSLDEAQEEADAEAREALEGPAHSMEDIFTAFKRGVEKQVDSDDYDTHYNLGIAYREMGLVDEAIGAFQFAARDPARIVECCGILGLCFRDKGMPELALKWYRKGLDSPDLEDQEAIGLRYDMAEVYREQGDYESALKMYTDIYGIDSTYRDVSHKIEQMRGHLN